MDIRGISLSPDCKRIYTRENKIKIPASLISEINSRIVFGKNSLCEASNISTFENLKPKHIKVKSVTRPISSNPSPCRKKKFIIPMAQNYFYKRQKSIQVNKRTITPNSGKSANLKLSIKGSHITSPV